MQIPSEVLEKQEPQFCTKINPRDPYTSMIVGHSCRLVMGPGRRGDMYGVVAMVPDGMFHRQCIVQATLTSTRKNERGPQSSTIMGIRRKHE